jgi:diguanylate cyclase (GGDEF)-like protein
MNHAQPEAAQPTARANGAWLVAGLGGLLLTAAVVIWLFVLHGLVPRAGEVELRWWLLIPLFAVAEVLVIHLDVNREAQTISLSEIPMILGLFFAAPQELVASQFVGAALTLIAYRRQPLLKLVFNLGQFAVVTAIAIGIFRALVPAAEATGPRAWLAAVGAAVVADIVAAGLVSTAIGLLESWRAPGLATFFGLGLVTTFANAALGLLGVELVRGRLVSGALLIVPFAVAYLAYRGFWREHRRSQHFEFLYESMVRLNSSADLDGAVHQLLHEARTMFQADIAGVVVFSDDPSDPPRRGVLGPTEDVATLTPLPVGEFVGHPQEELLIKAARGKPTQHLPILGRAVHDAIAVTLRSEARIVGAVVVANRIGDVNSFTKADLRFLRTFGTHALVALEKRHLLRSLGELSQANHELSHQALHDPLTHLPNRTLFVDRLEQALNRRDDSGSQVGILFVDLDNFKHVNDTHGHAIGDRVLSAVAERIRACLRPSDTAARIGGDEFTILLDGVSGAHEAQMVSERILNALRVPIATGDGEVQVGASIGQAMHSRTPGSGHTLMREADTAMYTAKSQGKGRWVAAACPDASPAAEEPALETSPLPFENNK